MEYAGASLILGKKPGAKYFPVLMLLGQSSVNKTLFPAEARKATALKDGFFFSATLFLFPDHPVEQLLVRQGVVQTIGGGILKCSFDNISALRPPKQRQPMQQL